MYYPPQISQFCTCLRGCYCRRRLKKDPVSQNPSDARRLNLSVVDSYHVNAAAQALFACATAVPA
jgi:hypothetical protein